MYVFRGTLYAAIRLCQVPAIDLVRTGLSGRLGQHAGAAIDALLARATFTPYASRWSDSMKFACLLAVGCFAIFFGAHSFAAAQENTIYKDLLSKGIPLSNGK